MRAFNLLRIAVKTLCLSLTSLFLASANAQSAQPIFPVLKPIAIPVGAAPVFTGDFKGDGGVDLAYYSSASPQSVGIILDFGKSTATTVTTPLCVSGAAQPSFADVNNDKKLDLVYSCGGFLTIQFGNGDGTFQPVTYFGNYSNLDPVLADLNGDGYLDIAALTYTVAAAHYQVAVFLNKGAVAPGTFASPVLYAAPAGGAGSLTGLLAGDFNGDGKQDLLTSMITITGNQFALTAFSVLYGNGDGTLNAPKTQPNADFYSFAAGDFNKDGVTDIALFLAPTANNVFTSIEILLGTNSQSFTKGASIPVRPHSIVESYP